MAKRHKSSTSEDSTTTTTAKQHRPSTSEESTEKEDKEEAEEEIKKREKKDVTSLLDLKKSELVEFLWKKVLGKNNQLSTVEHCACLKGTLPLDSKGYCKNLRLMKKGIGQWKMNLFSDERKQKPWFTKASYQWSATGLALVKAGHDPPDSHYEASHLCNHPWCLNAEHLRWEIPTKNYKRKNCNANTTCPNCQHKFNPCVHNPMCLPCNIPNCSYHIT